MFEAAPESLSRPGQHYGSCRTPGGRRDLTILASRKIRVQMASYHSIRRSRTTSHQIRKAAHLSRRSSSVG